MGRKFTYKDIKEYIESFGYKLLSKEYNPKEKILVQCDKGHIYEVKFYSFKNGSRCPKCKSEKQRGMFSFNFDYVKEHIESFGYKLLSKKYINNRTKILIQCNKGHIYETTFDNFRSGKRCRDCSGSKKHTLEEVRNFLSQFDYKLLSDEYKNNKTKLKMECPQGHIIELKFNHFQSGIRCSKCKRSKGEEKIDEILCFYNIKHIQEYKFDDCRLKMYLPFDFYLPDYNICIEYDGEQHYKIARNFNLDTLDLMNIKYRDKYKTQYCKNNNIKLIRIPYWEFNNIEEILKRELNLK